MRRGEERAGYPRGRRFDPAQALGFFNFFSFFFFFFFCSLVYLTSF